MKHPRKKSPAHLAYIRQLPCLVCGDNTSVQAAHVRYGNRVFAKRDTGMGEKPDDRWTVPLCGEHHREQHQMNEKAFWAKYEKAPLFFSLILWGATGDVEAGEQIIREAQ